MGLIILYSVHDANYESKGANVGARRPGGRVFYT